ncbi:MAG TPA: transporter [Caulobacteraceae bacterium]|jgi:hypothetical protein|nr:transporter [Caulobacteraceae bacterium]
MTSLIAAAAHAGSEDGAVLSERGVMSASVRQTILCVAALAAGLGLASPAFAGPPFITDDPEPTDQGHWEIYTFTEGTHTPGDTAGEAGLDFNYGGAKNLQLTAVIPAGYDNSSWGMGDVELAAKYKFLHQDGPAGLDVAVFPRVFLPTAFDRHGDRHASLLIPIWAQKDFGKWSVFGGGGYQINPGAGNRNFWISGLTVTRQLSERFMLGAEVYHQTADTDLGRDWTVVNLGGQVKMTKHWSLLVSGGPGVEHPREAGQSDFYLSLKADY